MTERPVNRAQLQTGTVEFPVRAGLPASAPHSPPLQSHLTDTVFENIRQALQGLQFGEITITVRNGAVVQIERVARKRQFKFNHGNEEPRGAV